MFHLLTFPSVAEVDESVGGLDDGRIAKFALGLFQDEGSLPVNAVPTEGEIQRASPVGGMVVNEEMASVLERKGIGARVGVWKIQEGDRAPGESGIAGGDVEELALAGASYREEVVIIGAKETGLNGADGDAVME